MILISINDPTEYLVFVRHSDINTVLYSAVNLPQARESIETASKREHITSNKSYLHSPTAIIIQRRRHTRSAERNTAAAADHTGGCGGEEMDPSMGYHPSPR